MVKDRAGLRNQVRMIADVMERPRSLVCAGDCVSSRKGCRKTTKGARGRASREVVVARPARECVLRKSYTGRGYRLGR